MVIAYLANLSKSLACREISTSAGTAASARRLALAALIVVAGGCGPAHVRIDPEASDKRYLLAADYFNKGLVSPAMEELLKSVELNPDNADAHNLLGIVHLRKAVEGEELATRSQCLRGAELVLEKQAADKEFKKAEKEFQEAIRLRADFSEAHNNMAVVSQHFGRYDESLASSEKALTNITYREPWAANGNLGLAYTSKGDLARAAVALRKALFDQPKFCVGHYRLAQVYKQEGETERAKEELELVFAEKNCPIQEAYQLGGLIALKLGDRDRARELFQHCVDLAPKSCLARQCTF